MRLALVLLLSTTLSALWPLRLAAQDVVITEFLALGGQLADEDGDFPDWIEIQNRDASAVDLDGWYLTDDAADLRKWRFPATTIRPGDSLVVFASGKDGRTRGKSCMRIFSLPLRASSLPS